MSSCVKLDVKSAAIKVLTEQLIGEFESEWDNMYGNAKLRGFPYEDDESELFWDRLWFRTESLIEMLEEDLREDMAGYHTKVFQIGRSGGTIFPAFDSDMGGWRHFRSEIDTTFIVDWDDLEQEIAWGYSAVDGIDDVHYFMTCAYESAKKYRDALKNFNQTVKGAVAGVAEWWEEEKEYLKEMEEAA